MSNTPRNRKLIECLENISFRVVTDTLSLGFAVISIEKYKSNSKTYPLTSRCFSGWWSFPCRMFRISRPPDEDVSPSDCEPVSDEFSAAVLRSLCFKAISAMSLSVSCFLLESVRIKKSTYKWKVNLKKKKKCDYRKLNIIAQ